jgi:hypothetical protein
MCCVVLLVHMFYLSQFVGVAFLLLKRGSIKDILSTLRTDLFTL